MRRDLIERALDALRDDDTRYATELLEIAVGDQKPTCPVCGVRAWPGDESRHLWSRHQAAEESEESEESETAA